MDVAEELGSRADEVNGILLTYLPEEKGFQKTVMEAMNYSVLVGGKRLRPVIMLETFRLFGGNSKIIEPFLAAIEMIHTYSLVHDDLPAMDDDMLRRGNPTTHAKFGEAMGILAGDGLLNYAVETATGAFDLISNDDETKSVVKAIRILFDKSGINGMLGGQVADVEEDNGDGYTMTKDKIEFIYEKKTACLIEASLMIGAVLAGASDEAVKKTEEIGHDIGIAFQIVDDILDIEGSSDKTGKSHGQDEKNNKTTYVSLTGLDKAKEDVRWLTEDAMGILSNISGDSTFLKKLMQYLTSREA
ncbi:MAG: polyprenyl synthetase family protein [Lachnospiraceae bacterium]|nr:polyprenyl synthetase family protein [Lachnospiraceae bacterium]